MLGWQDLMQESFPVQNKNLAYSKKLIEDECGEIDA
jgi:hypothetical protein